MPSRHGHRADAQGGQARSAEVTVGKGDCAPGRAAGDGSRPSAFFRPTCSRAPAPQRRRRPAPSPPRANAAAGRAPAASAPPPPPPPPTNTTAIGFIAGQCAGQIAVKPKRGENIVNTRLAAPCGRRSVALLPAAPGTAPGADARSSASTGSKSRCSRSSGRCFPKGGRPDRRFADDPAATQSSVVNLDQRLDALEKQVADLVRQSEENGNRLQHARNRHRSAQAGRTGPADRGDRAAA